MRPFTLSLLTFATFGLGWFAIAGVAGVIAVAALVFAIAHLSGTRSKFAELLEDAGDEGANAYETRTHEERR